MKKPINKSKLGIIDLLSLVTHIIMSIFLLVVYDFELVAVDTIKKWTNFYFFILPLFLMGLQFRNLRNMRYYVIWVILGVIQLTVYFYIDDNPDFIFPNGTGLNGLKALLPVLIMYQILRQISIKFFHREMIISMRYGRMTWYEEEDKRNMTWIEVLFTLILVGTTLLFNVI